MARFDVYRVADGALVLDCQNDLLDDIGTRFVLPLVPPGESAPQNSHLNPVFEIEGEKLVLLTQFATSLRSRELRAMVVSLEPHRDRIVSAIDVLIGAG